MKILHNDQLSINTQVVKSLIKEQFPEYKNLPVREFDSTGTVNSIFRLGKNYYIRLPKLKEYADSIVKEYNLLLYLSEKITIEIPQPIKLGKPNNLYPLHWAIYNWIKGEPYDNNRITNFQIIISELSDFIKELHAISIIEDAPKAGRKPLLELDGITVEALNASREEIKYTKAVKIWEIIVNTPIWNNKTVWIHADLLKSNILIRNNHISAIIDFGSAGVGDPAFDIIPAWTVFDSKNRNIFRKKLDVDDTLWHRACAYALHQAALIIPYYRKSNPVFVKSAIDTINEIIIDYNSI
ncbi:MAG: aminoglycoside phosphotransferase family protein [Spirochaetaceae bacterium]|jgi:aminoglycoside phosphotransferase (APT) family kinase protein|nr:aminoglycoside phosphotransferase family protein [Spirochaetaceae bacterium]